MWFHVYADDGTWLRMFPTRKAATQYMNAVYVRGQLHWNPETGVMVNHTKMEASCIPMTDRRTDNGGDIMQTITNALREAVVEPDDDRFHAYCPGLRGLHADGATEEEALEHLKECLIAYLLSMMKHALRETFGDEYTALSADARAAVDADTLDLATVEYRTALGAAETMRARIRPATLASYARTLLAGRK